MIGQTISHYKITEKLGEGGMGVVYKAEDLTLDRHVALKFLPHDLSANEAAKTRFIREAKAASALEHPNICNIYEIDETPDGSLFMVMPCYEGETLKDRLERGPLEIDEALDLAVQVASGLARAHEKGIVHRDIKPGNVMLTDEGRHATLMDFGLAKKLDTTKMTQTGMTVGTVAYMSPEQALGKETDGRTDVWSLGVMLYEMLTGKLPFRGDVEPAMIYSIINEEPEYVTTLRKEAPLQVEALIEKALTKDVAKRYPGMEELLRELEEISDQLALGIKERRFVRLRRLRRRRRFVYGSAIVVALAAAVIATQLFYTESMALDSIAVLPLVNLSGDPDQDYLVDGITGDLITGLSRVSAFEKVISRASMMQYKGTDKPLKDIARELGVKALMAGTVQRMGDQVKLGVELIHAGTGENLWSESYNREGRDVAILLSEVTRAIADRIEVALTPQEQGRLTQVRTVDPEAHDAYLKGRYYSYEWTEEGFNKGIRYFREAIEIDPTYALPYAGLADCYSNLSLFAFMSHDEALPKARAAAKKAVELDPSLGVAHAMLGWIKFVYDWDWYGPDADFRRAVELNPNNPDVHIWYDSYLTLVGRHEEAIVHGRRAVELDPLTSTTTLNLAWVYEYAGQYDDAIEVTKTAIEMRPSDPYGPLQLAGGYFGKGMYAEAVAAIDSAFALMPDPDDEVFLFWAGYAYGGSDRKDKATEILNRLLALSEREYVGPMHIAMVYKGLGQTDEMFEWLERGYENHSDGMMFLKVNFGEFRDDPRYIDLCRRIGIPINE